MAALLPKGIGMTPVRFGKTGLKVSPVCFGTMTYGDPKWREWVLPEEQSMPFYRKAYEAGITFWDTADMYSLGESERITGKAIKEVAARRDEIVLATKVYNAMGPGANQRGLSRKHVMEAVDASLKRLGTDYIDLYIIHRLDPETGMEEICEALNDVVRAGKALYLGASSMWAWQFMKLLGIQRKHGFAEFVSMQNYYNLVYREEEREMMPLCTAEGRAVTPWSPLARGYLAGSGLGKAGSNETTVRGRTDDALDRLRVGSGQDETIRVRLHAEAQALGVKPAVLALAWVMSKPFVTSPIVGASKPQHIDDAVAAASLKVDPEVWGRLEAPYEPKRVVGFA
jgi:aryl-alcohol dehydrogenase-like predicted oxidoreductase